MKYSLRNCWRNRRVSLISVAVVLISALFLMIFFSSITTYQQELRQSYAALKASAHITAYPSSEKPRLPVDSFFISKILTAIFIHSFRYAFSIRAFFTFGKKKRDSQSCLPEKAYLCASHLHSVTSNSVNTALKEDCSGLQA